MSCTTITTVATTTINTLADLLARLDANGATVALDNDANLALDLPDKLATTGIVAEIRNHKSALVAMLAADLEDTTALAWEASLPDNVADVALATALAEWDAMTVDDANLATWCDPADWHESIEIRDGQRWRVLARLDWLADHAGDVEVDPAALDALIEYGGKSAVRAADPLI